MYISLLIAILLYFIIIVVYRVSPVDVHAEVVEGVDGNADADENHVDKCDGDQ